VNEEERGLMAERVGYAWKNFEDQKAIIRAADLKAGYLVTFSAVFRGEHGSVGERSVAGAALGEHGRDCG